VSELPDVIEALRSQFNMQTEQESVWFLLGGAAALLALTESEVTIAAAVVQALPKS